MLLSRFKEVPKFSNWRERDLAKSKSVMMMLRLRSRNLFSSLKSRWTIPFPVKIEEALKCSSWRERRFCGAFLSYSKVGNDDVAVVVQQQVLELQVAMDDILS